MEKEEKKIKEVKKSINLKLIILIFIILIILFLLFCRFVSTKGFIVKEYAVKSETLNKDYDGLKIVHFSDLLYGSTVDIEKLEYIVNRINDQNPDIVVFTGDLFDSNYKFKENELENVIYLLNSIKSKVETLAVYGDNDRNYKNFSDIVNSLNWKFLDNTYEYVYYNSIEPIVFVGLDDSINGNVDINNAFSYTNEINNIYTIVLMHEPDQISDLKNYKFDLALAGHSLNGSIIFPFVGALYSPVGSKKYFADHYIVNNTDFYISGGIGTNKFNLRFNNKPSITLYRFYTK